MKTKITLGKSLNDLRLKSMGISLLTSIHYLVDISVYNSVNSSVSNLIRNSTRWRIEL
jgi:hypothetical protein